MGCGRADVARLLEAVAASKTLASRVGTLVSPDVPLLMPTRASISYPIGLIIEFESAADWATHN